MSKLDNDRVIAEIKRLNGNLSAVARSLGVARNTVYAHCERYATAKQALDEARETMLDNAESVLYRKVLEGDNTALIFFLKTQGYKRGYVERREITGADGGPQRIQIEPFNYEAAIAAIATETDEDEAPTA